MSFEVDVEENSMRPLCHASCLRSSSTRWGTFELSKCLIKKYFWYNLINASTSQFYSNSSCALSCLIALQYYNLNLLSTALEKIWQINRTTFNFLTCVTVQGAVLIYAFRSLKQILGLLRFQLVRA